MVRHRKNIKMETKANTHFMDKVVEALRKAATELEELQVKAALGKTEAEDKYEEVKKKFNLFIHESKYKIKEGKEKFDEINDQFDKLVDQLEQGRVDSIEKFKEQKVKFLDTLDDLEDKIRSNETMNKMYAFVLIEMEKFRLQLDVLEENFEKGKETSKATFEKGKLEFNQFVEKLKGKFSKEKEATQWEHFQGEITEAFTHFKKAFTKPS